VLIIPPTPNIQVILLWRLLKRMANHGDEMSIDQQVLYPVL
jgi:hypothetical protein